MRTMVCATVVEPDSGHLDPPVPADVQLFTHALLVAFCAADLCTLVLSRLRHTPTL